MKTLTQVRDSRVGRRVLPRSIALCITVGMLSATQALAVPIGVGQGLQFSQINFTFAGATANSSNHGLVAANIPVLLSNPQINPDQSSVGYINVVDGSGIWIVQNMPVDDTSGYPGISTMFDLTGSGAGQINTMSAYADFSTIPLIARPTGAPQRFPVSRTDYNAQGDGVPRPAPPGPGNAPNPNLVGWNVPDLLNTFLLWQTGHPSVEQDVNQCAPGAVANSFDWLRSTYRGLTLTLDLIPGIAGVPPKSLVAQLDTAMGRATSETLTPNEWMTGMLSFVDNTANGIRGKLRITHWPGAGGVNAGTLQVGRTVSTDASASGLSYQAWLIQEVAQGEGVELRMLQDFGGGVTSGQVVDLIGAGQIAGVPWIAFVLDAKQGASGGTNWFDGGIGWSTLTRQNLLPTWVGSANQKAAADFTVAEAPLNTRPRQTHTPHPPHAPHPSHPSHDTPQHG